MRILHGRYVAEGTEQVVHLSDMNRQKYRNQFKGKLYCPTEGCTALLSYSAGKKVYFKTWRLCHHSVDCMYHGKQVGFTSWQEDAKVTMSGNRKHNALQHAAKLFGGDRDKKARNVEQDRVSRLAKKQKNRQMTLYDDLLVDELVVKESIIRKKFVDELMLKDVGKVRLVLGYIESLKLIDCVAELVIQYDDRQMKVVYPEAFIMERLNRSYLNKFGAICTALKTEQLTFIGIGEIRLNEAQEMELIIDHGTDFKINSMDLSLFAKQYANG